MRVKTLFAQLKNRRTRRLTAVLLALAVTGAFGWLLLQPSTQQVLHDATSIQPETYTELYFTHPASLPSVVSVGRPAQIPFTVSNHEARTMAYQYRVTIVTNGQAHVAATGILTIPDQLTATQTATVAATKPGQTIELIIDLPDQLQTIHYRIQS